MAAGISKAIVALAIFCLCRTQAIDHQEPQVVGVEDLRLFTDEFGNNQLTINDHELYPIRIPYNPPIQVYAKSSLNSSSNSANIGEIRASFFKNGNLYIPSLVKFFSDHGTGHRVNVTGVGQVDLTIAPYLQNVIGGTYGPECVHIHHNVRSNLAAHLYQVLNNSLTSNLQCSRDDLSDYLSSCVVRHVQQLPDVLSNFVCGNQPDNSTTFIADQRQQLCGVLPQKVGSHLQTRPYLVHALLLDIVGDLLYQAVLSAKDLTVGLPNLHHELVYSVCGTFGGQDYGLQSRCLVETANNGTMSGLSGGGELLKGGKEGNVQDSKGLHGVTGAGGTGYASEIVGQLPVSSKLGPSGYLTLSNVSSSESLSTDGQTKTTGGAPSATDIE